MAEELQFDYYYGKEAEQFSFLRVPKLLIKDERFKRLSSDAKLLYGLLLDRMSLSRKNGWFDDMDRAFIYYAIEDIMEDLGCSKPTCIKIMRELDSERGIGLIEKKRQGLGRPDLIYVKNFATIPEKQSKEDDENVDNVDNVDNSKGDKIAKKPCKSTEVKNLYFRKSNNFTSESKEVLPQQVKNVDFKESKTFTSGSKETELPEVKEFDPNNTNNIYTDNSNTDNNKTEINYTDMELSNHILSITRADAVSKPEGEVYQKTEVSQKAFTYDKMDEIEFYKEEIRKNIDYDIMLSGMDFGKKEIYQEIYEIMCDVVCIRRDKIRINGTDYPYEVVKSRFLKLNSMHIDYVMECMRKTVSDIGNIRAYLITALFNAPDTINHYYQQLVNHDMYADAVGGN